MTPLMTAIFYGHSAIVDLLLGQEGLEVNKKDQRGISELVLACNFGNKDILLSLLRDPRIFCVNPKLLQSTKVEGISPLWVAVRNEKLWAVELLLASGRYLGIFDARTPIGNSHKQEHSSILEAAGDSRISSLLRQYLTDERGTIQDLRHKWNIAFSCRIGEEDFSHLSLSCSATLSGTPLALTHLALVDCKISSFPISGDVLTDLVSLNLSFNLISELPPSLFSLKYLRLLKLSGNPLGVECFRALGECVRTKNLALLE
jgi:hypothetical protein